MENTQPKLYFKELNDLEVTRKYEKFEKTDKRKRISFGRFEENFN